MVVFKLNHSLMPSLESVAIQNIVTTLWKQGELTDLLRDSHVEWLFHNYSKQLKSKMMEKVSRLWLPEVLKSKVCDMIVPLTFQVLEWKKFYCYHVLEGRTLKVDLFCSKLCWTSYGTLDRKRTAELLIRDERWNVSQRYQLACIYCFQEDILNLWGKLPAIDQHHFCNYWYTCIGGMNRCDLVVFWSNYISGKSSNLNYMIGKISEKCSFYRYAFQQAGYYGNRDTMECVQKCSLHQYVFQQAAYYGNRIAMEYFWSFLSPQQRRESVAWCMKVVAYKYNSCARLLDECYTQVLYFLLSQMDEEQQSYVFETYPLAVLKGFLHWPWRHFLIPAAKLTVKSLCEAGCEKLLEVIVNEFNEGCTKCNYHDFFKEIWQLIPSAYKNNFAVRFVADMSLSRDSFSSEDKKIVSQVLNDASVEKKALVFSDEGELICVNLIWEHKWEILNFFIDQCVPASDSTAKFKKTLECTSCPGSANSREKVEVEFQKLISDIAQNVDKKRSMKDDTSSGAKRLCTKSAEGT